MKGFTKKNETNCPFLTFGDSITSQHYKFLLCFVRMKDLLLDHKKRDDPFIKKRGKKRRMRVRSSIQGGKSICSGMGQGKKDFT